MPLSYCSVSQVLDCVGIFVPDVSDQFETIPSEQIERYIAEASEDTRLILSPRFELAVIDSYDPNFPLGVVSLTKLRAAMYMLDRLGGISGERNATLKALLQAEHDKWARRASNGSLLDTTGLFVPQQSGADSTQSDELTVFNTELEALYASGPRNY